MQPLKVSSPVFRASAQPAKKTPSHGVQLRMISQVASRICKEIRSANAEQKGRLAEQLKALRSRMIKILTTGRKESKVGEINTLFKAYEVFKEKTQAKTTAFDDFAKKVEERAKYSQETEEYKKAHEEVKASSLRYTGIQRELREHSEKNQELLRKNEFLNEYVELNKKINDALEVNANNMGIDSSVFKELDESASAILAMPEKKEKAFSLVDILKGICNTLKYMYDFYKSDRNIIAKAMNSSNQCLSDVNQNKTPPLKLLEDLQNSLDKLSQNPSLEEGTRNVLEAQRDQLKSKISEIRSDKELAALRPIIADCEKLLGSKCTVVSRSIVERLTQQLDKAFNNAKELQTKNVILEYRMRINDALLDNEELLSQREEFFSLLDELYVSPERALYYLNTGHLFDENLNSLRLERLKNRFLLLEADIPDRMAKKALLLQIRDGKITESATREKLEKEYAEIQRLTNKIDRNDRLQLEISERKKEVYARESLLSSVQRESDSVMLQLKEATRKEDALLEKKKILEQELLSLSNEIMKLAEIRVDAEKSPREITLEENRREISSKLQKLVEEEKEILASIKQLEADAIRLPMEIQTLASGVEQVKDRLQSLYDLLQTPGYYDIPEDRRKLDLLKAQVKQNEMKLQLLTGF